MELARVTKLNVDLSSEFRVLDYAYTGAEPIEVIARVDLGSIAKPIAGGGNYSLSFYINNILITPTTVDIVPGGRTRTIVVSRPVPISSGDTVSVGVTGRGADLGVDIVTTLRDATPVTRGEAFGIGSVIVDHNYGGTDNLAVQLSSGPRVDGATIQAFRAVDWNANNRSDAFVLGRTVTDSNGRWRNPLLLDPGSYVLFISERGVIKATPITLTVT